MGLASRRSDPTALHPFRALRGLCTVIRDNEDTEAGSVMVGSLAGRSWERFFERFAAHPMGARILAEERRLDLQLLDRDSLAALGTGTLGRAYLESTQDIDPAGMLELVSYSFPVSEPTRECELLANRECVAHDLWHVVTGYGRDLLGEAALVQMMWLQTRNTGYILPILLTGLSHAFHSERRRIVLEARHRARACAWLPAQDWEALLGEPLPIVREKLGLGSPPTYTPVFEPERTLRVRAAEA